MLKRCADCRIPIGGHGLRCFVCKAVHEAASERERPKPQPPAEAA